MAMKKKGTHLTSENRYTIQHGIEEGKTKSEIAKEIGADPSTIAKEIRNHICIHHLKSEYSIDCAIFAQCKRRHGCKSPCEEYIAFYCKRRDKTPGACNGCEKRPGCHYEKHLYKAADAQHDYKITLVTSREGVNITEEDAKQLGELVKQLLNQGQSPYEILMNNPEIEICEKTLYNYIDQRVFAFAGVLNIDLRQKVSRKLSVKKKDQVKYKPRRDLSYLKGRKKEDMDQYIAAYEKEHGTPPSTVEMDTMYNDIVNGPFVQTFKLVNYEIALAIYHTRKTAEFMIRGLDQIEKMLGKELFEEIFQILKPDRGTEFEKPEGFEFRADGSRRTRVFYCDPMASWQKPHVENKHVEYRYILPNEQDLYALGLNSQKQLNLVLSHLNSRSLKELSIGKKKCTPFMYARFYCPELVERMNSFGIEEIDANYVILKPYLLDEIKRKEAISKIKKILKKMK